MRRLGAINVDRRSVKFAGKAGIQEESFESLLQRSEKGQCMNTKWSQGTRKAYSFIAECSFFSATICSVL